MLINDKYKLTVLNRQEGFEFVKEDREIENIISCIKVLSLVNLENDQSMTFPKNAGQSL